jgi:carbamoyltransferase
MNIWGISAGGHDAAIAVLKNDSLVWAAHSERYSGVKNDATLNQKIIDAAQVYGSPDLVVWHEQPFKKRLRELYAGQFKDAFSAGPKSILKQFDICAPIKTVSHHHSHAAAAYYTSGFKSAAVLVIDAIGEWETLTVWHGVGDQLIKIKSVDYPNSLGLFYSAMTQRCGFKPNEEEYIMMGMAAFGDKSKYQSVIEQELVELTDDFPFFKCKFNHHRGFKNWRPEIVDLENLAAAAQELYNKIVLKLSRWININVNKRNLVISGGCALNCVTNAAIAKQWRWNKIWVMPNPGDAGNSIGAALAYNSKMIEWQGPYLGDAINGRYPVMSAFRELNQGRIVGVANGRAEFGPRALGNRSLFADPRIPDIKDQLNQVKKREQFRPFAPVVMAEYAKQYFENITQDLSYMQYAVRCKFPEQFPGIVHVDGTSRVQTVTATQNPGLHNLLRLWYATTECPMLVNTSLNIKGKPMVNTVEDANHFENIYGIRVFTQE